MSRTRKRPYTKSRRFDASCRCHGGCPWCESNRAHATRRRRLTADEQLQNEVEERSGNVLRVTDIEA